MPRRMKPRRWGGKGLSNLTAFATALGDITDVSDLEMLQDPMGPAIQAPEPVYSPSTLELGSTFAKTISCARVIGLADTPPPNVGTPVVLAVCTPTQPVPGNMSSTLELVGPVLRRDVQPDRIELYNNKGELLCTVAIDIYDLSADTDAPTMTISLNITASSPTPSQP